MNFDFHNPTFAKSHHIKTIISDKEIIAETAIEKSAENDAFRMYLKQLNASQVDDWVIAINQEVERQIDCTLCGACCNQLIIHITDERADMLAKQQQISRKIFDEMYIEKSTGGQMVLNTVPCHFLCEKKCTIYENRFDECRNFPALDQPGITNRLFATLMHYGMCPIIFNVIEELKERTDFKD